MVTPAVCVSKLWNVEGKGSTDSRRGGVKIELTHAPCVLRTARRLLDGMKIALSQDLVQLLRGWNSPVEVPPMSNPTTGEPSSASKQVLA